MASSAIDAALVRDVDLLCLDAGNTVIFLDHARVAELCAREGFVTSAQAIERAEGRAKVAIDDGEVVDFGWSDERVHGARGWGVMMGTILHKAGLAPERVAGMLGALWREHRARNFWCVVPEGLSESLLRARASGVRVAVISNSEGILEQILEEVGILRSFDLVIDSGVAGVEKPDPGIFRLAFERTGVPGPRALHLGDTYATDVVGARAAGIRVALIDPYGHLAGRYSDVPRVPGASQVADAIALARL